MQSINSLFNLRGRRALITGGAGSLGRVIGRTLADLGSDLLLLDRESSPLLEVASELRSMDAIVDTSFCDLESEEEREELIRHILRSGQLDILINNAAFVGSSDLNGWAVPFSEQSISTWRRALEVNLTAPFHLAKGLAPLLKKSGHGCIINITSIYGEYAPDWGLYDGTSMGNPAAYSASKGGLLQLTRWLATTLAPHIRVNAISPGGIARGQPEQFISRYEKKTPLARMANEQDFQGAIAFMASDMSAYVTGQSLSVDGGWGIW